MREYSDEELKEILETYCVKDSYLNKRRKMEKFPELIENVKYLKYFLKDLEVNEKGIKLTQEALDLINNSQNKLYYLDAELKSLLLNLHFGNKIDVVNCLFFPEQKYQNDYYDYYATILCLFVNSFSRNINYENSNNLIVSDLITIINICREKVRELNLIKYNDLVIVSLFASYFYLHINEYKHNYEILRKLLNYIEIYMEEEFLNGFENIDSKKDYNRISFFNDFMKNRQFDRKGNSKIKR